MNISCILAAKILRESVDGADVILDAVNRYNAVLDDYIIPGVFHALFDITAELKTEDKELVLLREPKEAGYYEFSAKDDLVITNRYPGFTPDQIKKSFHADTYCFDSIPEKECFMFAHSLLHLFFGFVPLRRGTGLRSAVDKLRHQNLLGLCLAGVHQAHPAHRIAGFQLLRRARRLRQLEHHLLQTAVRRLLDLQQVRVQLLAHQKLIVKNRTVFLQVCFPHPAVLAQGLLRLLAQAQVGNQVISVPRVSQVVLHV